MKHYPQIVYANAKNLANFFALQTVHFAQSKRARRALRQRRKTIAENLPEVAALNQLSRGSMPFARGAVGDSERVGLAEALALAGRGALHGIRLAVVRG